MGRPSKFDPAFKAKVAVEALQEKEPLAVLAKKYKVAPSVITSWKEELLHNSSKAFESDAADKREVKQLKQQNERLMRKVGQLTLECDFFAQACEDAGLKVRWSSWNNSAPIKDSRVAFPLKSINWLLRPHICKNYCLTV